MPRLQETFGWGPKGLNPRNWLLLPRAFRVRLAAILTRFEAQPEVIEELVAAVVFLQKPEGAFFEGECVPNIDDIKTIYTEWDRNMYPHAWRGAILCFTLGLFVCVLTGGYYKVYGPWLNNE